MLTTESKKRLFGNNVITHKSVLIAIAEEYPGYDFHFAACKYAEMMKTSVEYVSEDRKERAIIKFKLTCLWIDIFLNWPDRIN